MTENNIFQMESIDLTQEPIREINSEINIDVDSVSLIDTRSIKLFFLCGLPSLFMLLIVLVFILKTGF